MTRLGQVQRKSLSCMAKRLSVRLGRGGTRGREATKWQGVEGAQYPRQARGFGGQGAQLRICFEFHVYFTKQKQGGSMGAQPPNRQGGSRGAQPLRQVGWVAGSAVPSWGTLGSQRCHHCMIEDFLQIGIFLVWGISLKMLQFSQQTFWVLPNLPYVASSTLKLRLPATS